MMTSGEKVILQFETSTCHFNISLFKVKYASSIDCFRQVVRTEGVNALFRGAGVNVVRGVAGAGVLSGFDKFKNIYIGWRYKSIH